MYFSDATLLITSKARTFNRWTVRCHVFIVHSSLVTVLLAQGAPINNWEALSSLWMNASRKWTNRIRNNVLFIRLDLFLFLFKVPPIVIIVMFWPTLVKTFILSYIPEPNGSSWISQLGQSGSHAGDSAEHVLSECLQCKTCRQGVSWNCYEKPNSAVQCRVVCAVLCAVCSAVWSNNNVSIIFKPMVSHNTSRDRQWLRYYQRKRKNAAQWGLSPWD